MVLLARPGLSHLYLETFLRLMTLTFTATVTHLHETPMGGGGSPSSPLSHIPGL